MYARTKSVILGAYKGIGSLLGAIFLLNCANWAVAEQAEPISYKPPSLEQFNESSFPSSARSAYRAFSKGDKEKALAEISKLESNPRLERRERIMLLKGLVHLAASEGSAAKQALKSGLQARGSDSDLLFVYGLAQRSMGETNQGLASMEEALWFSKFTACKPEEVLIEIHRAHTDLNNPAKAAEALERALAKDPGSVLVKTSLARTKLQSGAKNDAIRIAREAIAADPAAAGAKLILAEALLMNSDPAVNRNQIEEARKIASAIADSGGADPQTVTSAASLQIKALTKLGDLQQANKVLAQSLKKNPHSQELQRLQQQLKLEAA